LVYKFTLKRLNGIVITPLSPATINLFSFSFLHQGEDWVGTKRLSGFHDRSEEQEQRRRARRHEISKEVEKRTGIRYVGCYLHNKRLVSVRICTEANQEIVSGADGVVDVASATNTSKQWFALDCNTRSCPLPMSLPAIHSTCTDHAEDCSGHIVSVKFLLKYHLAIYVPCH
jgi:hypothetical protein